MSALIKQKLRPVPYTPITNDGSLPIMADVAALILRNAGTATVDLWGGKYTLDSKETLSLNVTEDMAGLVVEDVTVTFGGAGTKQLQIIALKAANC